jgi:broad specificity phosphatase PhoE
VDDAISLSPTATKLLIVRHAETADNRNLRLAGWTDTDLSPRGVAQVALVAAHFNRAHADIAALYSSPLIRARRTAEGIGMLTGHLPVLLDDLREMNFGDLDGVRFDVLKEQYAPLLVENEREDSDFRWPGGESRDEFTLRVRLTMDRISLEQPGRTVAVVAHGGIVSTFLAMVHHESTAHWRRWSVPNASLTEVVWDPAAGEGKLLRRGDAAHLAELTAQEAEISR